MRQNNLLSIAIALLSIFTLGIAATVLESTPIESSYNVPTESDSKSGLSIIAVLFLLVEVLFTLLGVEIESTPGRGWPTRLEILHEAFIVLHSNARFLLVIGAVVVISLLASPRLRRLNTETMGGLLTHWFWSPEKPSRSSSTTDRWPPVEPEPGVSEAWIAMTERLEVDRPHARTPSEWAEAATNAGFDRDAVTNLTALFRAIRYGETTETTEHRRRATRELERLERE